jgi:hypothetical protein
MVAKPVRLVSSDYILGALLICSRNLIGVASTKLRPLIISEVKVIIRILD